MIDEKALRKASGRRLAAARMRAGYASQKVFAEAVGLSEPAIAKYEQGAREIPLAILFFLSTGHRISSNWIISGTGEQIEGDKDAAGFASERRDWRDADQDAELFFRLGEMVREVHADADIPLPDRALAKIARTLFEGMIETVSPSAGPDEISTWISFQRAQLARELRTAKEQPGTGKLSA